MGYHKCVHKFMYAHYIFTWNSHNWVVEYERVSIYVSELVYCLMYYKIDYAKLDLFWIV